MNSQEANGGFASTAAARALAALAGGSAGYRQFFQSLAGAITPEQIAAARQLFLRGRRALILVTVVFAAAHLLATFALVKGLPRFNPAAYGWVYDFERAGLFLAAFFLAARRAVPLAGRLLLPLGFPAFLPWTAGLPEFDWLPRLRLIELIVVLWASGLCLDLAMSRGKLPAKRKVQLAWLAAAAAIFLAEVFLRSHPAQPGWFSLAAVAAVFVAEGIGRGRSAAAPESPPVEFFLAAAWRRWRVHATGLSLAVGLGIFPLLAFFNQLDVEAQLEKYHSELLANSSGEDKQASEMKWKAWKAMPADQRMVCGGEFFSVWAWGEKGHLLTDADFENGRMYALNLSKLDDLQHSNVLELLRQFGSRQADATVSSNLEAALASLRINDATQFINVVTTTGSPYVLYAANGPDGIEVPSEAFVPVHGRAVRQLARQSITDIDRMLGSDRRYQYLFLAFGVAGFVFLWRRGGDSKLARWLGIWLIGTGLTFYMHTLVYFLPGVREWLFRLTTPGQGNVLFWGLSSVFDLLSWAGLVLVLLFLAGVPQGVIWGMLCGLPEPAVPGEPLRYRWRYYRNLAACAAVNTVITLSFLWWKGRSFFAPTLEDETLLIKGHVLSLVLLLVLGWIFRKRTATRSELPQLGLLPVAAYAAANLTLVLLTLFYYHQGDPDLLNLAGTVCGVGFCLLAAFLIIKRDFLKVRSIRSFTAVMLIIGLPVALRLAEELLKPLLRHTPLFSEHGADMVVLILALVLLPRLHHLLDRAIVYVTDRKLGRIEHEADHAVDAINSVQTPEEKRALLLRFLDYVGIQDHALYHGAGVHQPLRLASKSRVAPPESLSMTDELTRFLNGRHDFIDLQDGPYEWEFFFFQFDLHALEERTRCRYLLPITAEGSLLGVMLLADGSGCAEDNNPLTARSLIRVAAAAMLRA